MTIQHETWQVFTSVLLGLDMIFFLRIFLHAFGFNEWEVLPPTCGEPSRHFFKRCSIRFLPYQSVRCNAVGCINAD